MVKNQKGAIPIIAGCAVISCAFLAILMIMLVAVGSFSFFGDKGESEATTDSSINIDCNQTKIPKEIMERINQNASIYQSSAKKSNIPWEIIAAVHYREASNDPNRSVLSGEKLGTKNPDSGKVYNTLQESSDGAAEHLKTMVKSVYKFDLSASSDDNVIKHAFLAYDRGSMYKKHGCSVDESPYVMNQFDEAHKNMRWPNSECEPKSTRGKVNTPLGAFTVFKILKDCQK